LLHEDGMKERWLVFCLLGLGTTAIAEADVFGVFVGSTPADRALLEPLGVPANAEIERVQWKLTLHRDPARYELQYEYGAGTKGVREGVWNVRRGIKSDPRAIVYELRGAFALAQVDVNLIQVLDEDFSYRIGNGGWSFTLNRSDQTEPRVDEKAARNVPDMSYPISSLATGPDVHAVFDGRTPCQGIAQQLKVRVPRGCSKAKWRLTLYRDPATRAPTRYKVEGSLFTGGAREGTWKIVRGLGEDSDALVYRLDATATQPELLLLKGDENVLFILNEARDPRVGHAEFSYTLDRTRPVS
jgi:hypothetical protein